MKCHALFALSLILSFLFTLPLWSEPENKGDEIEEEKVDDWELELGAQQQGKGWRQNGGAVNFSKSPQLKSMPFRAAPTRMAPMPSKKLGFAVGGAADVNTFRENINNKFLPLGSSITVEGLYNDYFFDTGLPTGDSKTLFSPTYTFANSADPISGKEEYYMAVGLHSNINADDFKRKKLNLVVVLDISGSMATPFAEYHYDKKQLPVAAMKKNKGEKKRDKRSKMIIANQAVQELTKQLRDDDRFGMVVFDNNGYVAKPLNLVGETKMGKIREHISNLAPRGGTNFEAGYKKGTELFDEFRNANPEEYENRIIFLTDAMPNRGQIAEEGLFGITEKNARQQIYSTFIGIGVDFNTDLIEAITKSKGANYYTVRSSDEFNKLLKDDFEYMVTPMVFDLSLKFESKGLTIDHVYGSPEADLATGELLKVNTLFPSRVEEEAVKGGLILLKLSGDPKGAEINLSANYEKRDGSRESGKQQVIWQGKGFDNTGIRKGVLLARYANLLANWCLEEQALVQENSSEENAGSAKSEVRFSRLRDMPKFGILPMPGFAVMPEIYPTPGIRPRPGIRPPPKIRPFPSSKLNKWERRSIALQVNPQSAATLKTFIEYFKQEAKELGDDELKQEIDILKKLISVSEKKPKNVKVKDESNGSDIDAKPMTKKEDWQLNRQ